MQITLYFKNIANTFKLDNRIKSLTEKEAFLTLKDHKPNFDNKQNCCLINLTKSEIGIMSKKFLDQINFFYSILKWPHAVAKFLNSHFMVPKIPLKGKCKFLKFKIVDFFPSITEDLPTKLLEFAQNYVEVDEH